MKYFLFVAVVLIGLVACSMAEYRNSQYESWMTDSDLMRKAQEQMPVLHIKGYE